MVFSHYDSEFYDNTPVDKHQKIISQPRIGTEV